MRLKRSNMGPAVLHVALGGAIGASLRYALGIGLVRMVGHTAFPIAVLAANVIGSFLMGVFVVAAARHGLTHLSPLIATGVLGGFTTFSAFSLETANLWERGASGLAAAYVIVSVVLSLGGMFAGLWFGRALA